METGSLTLWNRQRILEALTVPEVIPPKKKPSRKWLRRLAYVLGFLVLLVGAGIAVLQTDWARNRIKTYV